MSCTIVYNNKNKIDFVETSEGVRSKLFDQLSKFPHLSTLEDSLEVYKNVYSSKFKGEESPLEFISDSNNTFKTFKEALLDSTGGEIKLVSGSNTLLTVSSNTNEKTVGGFINNAIKSGILSDQKIVDQGDSFLKSEGYDEARQIANEIHLKEDAVVNLGGGSIKITRDGKISLVDKKSEVKYEDELSKSMGNTLKDVLERRTKSKPSQNLSENALQLKLLDLLNSMGVEVLSISNYVKKYKIRNGVEPSAEALADIANQVVAFKDGNIPVELLSEETAHFIVESWKGEEIENLLRNISTTDSYIEYAEQYREIYSKENPSMSSEEVENLVRREVLGKELAKSMQNSFNTEAKTETHKSIIRKIYEYFVNFFNGVKTNEKFYKDLEILTSKVQDLLINKDVNGYLDLDSLRNKKFRMYSVASGSPSIDSLRELTQITIQTLLNQERELNRAKKGSKASVEQLKDIDRRLSDLTKGMDAALLVKAVSEVLSLAQRQTTYIQEALGIALRKSETLSNEESLVLHQLLNQTLPALGRIHDISKDRSEEEYKKLTPLVSTVSANIIALKGKVDNTETDILERVLDRVMKRNQLPNQITKPDGTVRDVRAEMLEALKVAKKDTNMLFAYYGQLTHARDPLLNMLGSVIGDIFTNAEQNHLKRAKAFHKFMREGNYNPKDFKDFIDGKWMISLWDFREFENKERAIRIDALRQADPTITLTDEELSKKDVFADTLLKLTPEQNSKYQDIAAKAINKERENTFEDRYYEERESELASYSQYTRDQLRILSVQRGEIASRANVVNGRVRYNYADRINLDYLNLKRRGMKSLYNRDGSLKGGIRPDKNGELEVSGVKYSLDTNPSPEAQLAFDMHKIDEAFLQKLKDSGEVMDRGLSKTFEDDLDAITDEEEAKEFFLMNVNIAFSDSFWDSMEGTDSFIEKAEAVAGGDPLLEDLLDKYKKKVAERSAILKQFRDTRDATNTLANEMDSDIKKHVLLLSDEIDEYAREFSSKKGFEQAEKIEEAESRPNRAYFGALEDENLTTLEDKLKFAMDNMTPANLRKVREFNEALDDITKLRPISKRQQTLVERVTGTKLSDIDTSKFDQIKLDYAETKLAPYYRAFSPKGLTDTMLALEEGTKTVKEVVEALKNNPNVKLSNHFSYYEKSDIKYRNKNKLDSFDGGYSQPKLYDELGNEKYINKKFVQLFNPKREGGKIVFDEKGEITPTTNVEKYKLYKAVIDFQRDSLKSYGEDGRHNLFLAPQVSKTNMEEMEQFVKNKNKGQVVKEWWRDITKFRADELATGAEVDGKSLFKGSGIKVIPKYYLNLLEDEDSVSQDLFYTLMATSQQSELYRARQDKFSEVVVLQDTLEKRQYIQGKKVETTSTYKIFQNYMNGAIYGIREMREARITLPYFGQVNVTKIIDFLHNLLKNKALAYNVIIPATSWLTAEGTLLLEKYIGQYVDKDSYSRARRELRKLQLGSTTEAFEFDSNSKLNIIGEYFGVFDLDAKFKNAKYSKGIRTLGRAGYILHTAGNFTPISKSLLSGLYGHRLVGDTFLDFNKFKSVKGLDQKSAEAEWSLLESKSLYSYITINDKTNSVSYDYDRIAGDMGVTNDEAFKENFRNIELSVTSKIKKLVELIDGQIRPEERTLLQRDILGRFMMTHFAWAAIGASRRFKGRHYSFQTGIEEEGTYVSVGKFATRALNGLSKSKMKAFKEAWVNADDVERDNLKRFLKELAFLQGIFLVGIAYGAFADDDENKDVFGIQASAYLLDRVVNETSSSQLGILGEFYSKAESPITGLKNAKDMVSVWKYFDFSEVDSGSYKGMTESSKHFIKTIPGFSQGRDFMNAENLKTARDKYNFYNSQEDWIPLNYLISQEDLED